MKTPIARKTIEAFPLAHVYLCALDRDLQQERRMDDYETNNG